MANKSPALLLSDSGRVRFSLSLLEEDALPFPPTDRPSHVFFESILTLSQILSRSPTARPLLAAAKEENISIGLDPLLEPSGSFFYPHLRHFDLGFQPDKLQKIEKGQTRYLAAFIGGLRRAWHLKAGAAPDLSLSPSDFLRQYRHAEADIEAILHLIAWELRGVGQGGLWRYLLAEGGGLAAVFETVMAEDHKAQFNGRALKETFDHWFADRERVAAADHLALEIIDMALLRPEALGVLGQKSLSTPNIQKIGLLPGGQNYLAGFHLESVWYQGLDNDFNQRHLRHIENDLSRMRAHSALSR